MANLSLKGAGSTIRDAEKNLQKKVDEHNKLLGKAKEPLLRDPKKATYGLECEIEGKKPKGYDGELSGTYETNTSFEDAMAIAETKFPGAEFNVVTHTIEHNYRVTDEQLKAVQEKRTPSAGSRSFGQTNNIADLMHYSR